MNLTAPAIQGRDLSDRVGLADMQHLLHFAKFGRLVWRNNDALIAPQASNGLHAPASIYAVATALYFDWIFLSDILTDADGDPLYVITAAGLAHMADLADLMSSAATI